MQQKFLVFLLCLIALAAEAQLSANPWLEVNDEEELQEVYKKEQRRKRLSAVKYQAEDAVTIDRTSAYIQPEEMQEEKGVLDKVKDAINGKKEEPAEPIAATSYNKKKVAQQKAERQAEKEGTSAEKSSGMPSFGFGKQLGGLKDTLKMPKMPSLPSATGVIRKLERASGIDFKKIGNQLRK